MLAVLFQSENCIWKRHDFSHINLHVEKEKNEVSGTTQEAVCTGYVNNEPGKPNLGVMKTDSYNLEVCMFVWKVGKDANRDSATKAHVLSPISVYIPCVFAQATQVRKEV